MKILIAEDEAVSRRLLESTLTKWDYEVIVTCNGKEALEVLQSEEPPRLAILDWMMPETDGIHVCRSVREHREEPYIYILLLTSRAKKEDIVEGMKAGADDYITKPFHVHELEVRLRAGRRIIDLQEALIVTREELRIQATYDKLTGIMNRAKILETLEKEINRSCRVKQPLSIIIADLDHFKKINDTYGHVAGDIALTESARRMSLTVRPYDSTGRYGGEEFLMVLPGCNEESASVIANRLRESICSEPVSTPEGPINITVSMGVAVMENDREPDIDLLIRTADTALYAAKKAGRNRVEIQIL